MAYLCFYQGFQNFTTGSASGVTVTFKKIYGPFFWMEFNCLKLEPLPGDNLLLPLSSQKSLVLNLSIPEGWKSESTLNPPSGFEHGIPKLGMKCLNH